MSASKNLLCPSAPHDWPDARVFAVVGGAVDAPEVAYLDETLPVTQEILDMASPVTPDEVFRFAGACAQSRCVHYEGAADRCTLVQRTVGLAPEVVQLVPRCAIRTECRWWAQEGVEGCRRCPQVATRDYAASDTTRAMATPPNAPAAAGG